MAKIKSPYETVAARGVPTALATEEVPKLKPRPSAPGPVTSTVAPPLAPPPFNPLGRSDYGYLPPPGGQPGTPMQQLGPGPTPIPPQQPTSGLGSAFGNDAVIEKLKPLPGAGTTGTGSNLPGGTQPGGRGGPTPIPPPGGGGTISNGEGAFGGRARNPGQTPTVNPAVPMGFGGINFTPYGPGNTLRGTQITPGQGTGGIGGQMSQEASRARELASADLEGLSGPDRGSIASDTLRRLIADTQPQFEQELRGVGQRSAALGRLGSGMTTSDLGDVSQRRNQAITSEAGRLAGEAAGASLADRLDVFGARSGAASRFQGDDLAREGQAFSQGQGVRNEYRGERDFQDYMANQATDDQVRQLLLEDQMLNSSFGRDQSRLGTLSTGFGGVPDDAYARAAGNYSDQAQGNLDTVAQLAALYGNRRRAA